jgi:hypothetical protein
MNLFYFVIGGFVLLIFVFRSQLLIQEDSFKLILGISVVLFVAGLTLHFIGREDGSGALLCPLISLGLYRLFRKVFLRCFKHEPRDTVFNWTRGMGEDRVFNILYFMFAFCLWVLLPFGMEQLVKVGW